jgi:hypothetical protein
MKVTLNMVRNNPKQLYRRALTLHDQFENDVLGPIQAQRHWSDSKRHKTGAFYTPAHLVQFVITHTLYPTLQAWINQVKQARRRGDRQAFAEVLQRAESWQIVDPACGCGRFLLDAFRVLRDFHVWLARLEASCMDPAERGLTVAGRSLIDVPKDKRELSWHIGTLRALSCLYGYDLNPQAVAATQRILLEMAGLSTGTEVGYAAELASQILQERIQVGDALASVTYKDSLFSYEELTQPTMKWDIVISNPPWGASGSYREVAIKLGLPVANVNTFGLFLVNCLDKLPIGGRLGFVLPRNFCKGRDYAAIRRRLLQDARLEWLADGGQAFPGVTQEVVVLVLQRSSPGSGGRRICLTQVSETSPTGADTHSIDTIHFTKAPGNVFTLHARQVHLDVLAQIESETAMTLRDAVTWARGVEYGGNGALIRCRYCGAYASAPKKKQAEKTCPTCGKLLSTQEVAYNLITTQADTNHNVPIYTGKHVRRYRLGSPYYLDLHVPGIAYKDHQLFAGPKLLVPKIAPYVATMIETDGAWTTQGVYMLRPKDVVWDIYALLGLLNSAPLAFYYEYRFNDAAVLTTNVTLAHLLKLPLPHTNDARLLQDIRAGAQQLCAIQKPSTRQIAAHPANLRIDAAACQLFSLTTQQSACVMSWREGQQGW